MIFQKSPKAAAVNRELDNWWAQKLATPAAEQR